jgi:hypothetical protein
MPDTAAVDDLFARFRQLHDELGLPETDALRFRNLGGLPEIELVIRQVLDQAQQLSIYASLAFWVLQALFARKVAHKLLVAEVVGLLRGRGLATAETAAIQKMARQELIRRGLPEAKADGGASKVVQALAEALPPQDELQDQEALQALLDRAKELAAYFPGWQFEEKPYGCCVTVSLPAGRGHHVHVIAKGKGSAGHQIVEFQAVCGKVSPAHLEKVLRGSGRLEFGSYTIRRTKEADYFVLQHRVRLDEVTESVLNRVIPYLAEHADAMEAELAPNHENKY